MELIGHDFRKSLIEEEYGIVTNPSTPGNQTYNMILEQVYTVLDNLVWTYNIKYIYIDKDGLCLVILYDAAFTACFTKKRLKVIVRAN